MLAVELYDGAPFTFPPHPSGHLHPWAPRPAWGGQTALQLRCPGDWYSVWLFLDPVPGQPTAPPVFRGWYVNFERPYERIADGPHGIVTDDLELDLVLGADGSRAWKDVEHLHLSLAAGRMSLDDLAHVLEAAHEVSELLDRDDRWWAPWDDWRPTRG